MMVVLAQPGVNDTPRMPQKLNMPVALTIAGSDSGGGAGIQADLKTFAALGVHGTSVITSVTAQNPKRVTAIEPCSAAMVRRQLDAVFDELRPHAVKTGMLYSAEIIRTVARRLERTPGIPLVVDPVMIATSERRLLNRDALDALTKKLFRLATLVTPNLPEAAELVGHRIGSVEDMRSAAKEIFRRYGCAALVKGGHLAGSREAVDVLFDGTNEWVLTAPFICGRRLHGTGCTYSAAVTAYLAQIGSRREHRDDDQRRGLLPAVTHAKTYISGAIAGARRVQGHWVLNHFWNGSC